MQLSTSCGFLNALIQHLFQYDGSVLQTACMSNLPSYTLWYLCFTSYYTAPIWLYVCVFGQAAAEQRKESERKENERRQNQRTNVDFVRATQLLTTQKGVWKGFLTWVFKFFAYTYFGTNLKILESANAQGSLLHVPISRSAFLFVSICW